MTNTIPLIAFLLVGLLGNRECVGFLIPPGRKGFFSHLKGHNGKDGIGPGGPTDGNLYKGGDFPPLQIIPQPTNQTEHVLSEFLLRGGSTKRKAETDLAGGTKTTLSRTAEYWKNAFESSSRVILTPVRVTGQKLSGIFRSREEKEEEEILEKLQNVPIRTVALPKSSVVPKEVVHLAAKRSGMIGSPLRTDRVQAFAKTLKSWYTRKGYVLHQVVGATLDPNTATAQIQVQEPTVSQDPVAIVFYKEMVVDNDSGEVMTFRAYKENHRRRRTLGYESITKADVNTTFVETKGRIKPHRVSKALGMKPGVPFRWDPERWNKVSKSGLFSRIFKASPEPMRDGTVQLQVLATEAPLRHLEYGVSKSLYTGSWEGEIDFEHGNVLGGGETLGLVVRRGAKDTEPSIRVSFADDKFGMPGAYEVSMFSEALADQRAKMKDVKDEAESISSEAVVEGSSSANEVWSNRKGLTFSLRNPFSPKLIKTSSTSFSAERASTRSGMQEDIGSSTVNVGPFVKELPMEARSNVDFSVTTGCRLRNSEGMNLLPYSSTTVTTKQILPLGATGKSSTSDKCPILAFRHSVTTSSKHLPPHEANALGFASSIRGTEANGPISASVVGTTELRLPVKVQSKFVNQSGRVVLFGDWVLARREIGGSTFSKKSVGVGIRKDIQGLPLKLDFCYSNERKIKSMFGLGNDFDV